MIDLSERGICFVAGVRKKQIPRSATRPNGFQSGIEAIERMTVLGNRSLLDAVMAGSELFAVGHV
jgi:hypothetical protein